MVASAFVRWFVGLVGAYGGFMGSEQAARLLQRDAVPPCAGSKNRSMNYLHSIP